MATRTARRPKPLRPTVTTPLPGFAKPYLWLFGSLVAPPRLPLVGDINGDSYADFIYVSPKDKFIEACLNGRGWKPIKSQRLLSELPEEPRAACLAHLGGKTQDIALLDVKGILSKTLSTENGEFAVPIQIAEITDVSETCWLLAGTYSSPSVDNLLLLEATGRLRVIDADSGKVLREEQLPVGILEAVAADVNGDGCSELICRTSTGATIYDLQNGLQKLGDICHEDKNGALAAGDVTGTGNIDILLNGRVYLGPDFTRSIPIPGWEELTVPVLAQLADINGNGRADVVVHNRGKDGFGSTECDVNVYFTYFESDPDWDFDGLTNEEEKRLGTDPLDRDTDKDGLLDGWEVHGFAGIDFPGMGADPLHQDIFVENLLLEGVEEVKVDEWMRDQIIPFFADLNCINPSGRKGFALHYLNNPNPYLTAKFSVDGSWDRVAKEEFNPIKRGLWHWMLVTSLGGGGQSEELYDAGTSGMGSWVHEFGHQLGLSHSGSWQHWSPTYTSLMNYTWSYQFDGDPKKVHFSVGGLGSLVLNEARLPKKLPFAFERIKFLAGPPYRFRLKPAGPEETFVDWDWSGIFEDKTVATSITYGYGMTGGQRHHFRTLKEINPFGMFDEFTDYAPEVARHNESLHLLVARRAGPLEPAATRPWTAELRHYNYIGNCAWDEGVTLAEDANGDPCGISDGKAFYVFYPTPSGIKYRFGAPNNLCEAQLIPDTRGAYVRAINWQGTIYIFLHFGADKTIQYQFVSGDKLGERKDLGITSVIPPGPAVDTINNLLLLGTAHPYEKHFDRWQLRRLRWDRIAGEFRQIGWEWVGGEKSEWRGNRRVVVLFDDRPVAGPQGRVHFVGRTHTDGDNPGCFGKAQTIAYKDVNGGWLHQRYYDQWTCTKSAVGAAWFENDIVLATTWASGGADADGGLYIAFHGLGVVDADMGDFDDVTFMARYGLARSIQFFTQMPPA
jgi:hypothetical protein